jgi:4-carboxymuconolactone decarboxylase
MRVPPLPTPKDLSMPAAKKPSYRLPPVSEGKFNPAQQALVDALRAGPRGNKVSLGGPFGVYLHAPEAGNVIQEFAAFFRFKTRLSKRLSEFAILTIGRIWKAQYEFYVHAREAEAAGVKPETIRDVKAGRMPKKAPKDERAIYDFVSELHKKRRVSDRTYARVHAELGDAGMVEFVGILGCYSLVSMVLNTFRVPLPEGTNAPFAEPKVG